MKKTLLGTITYPTIGKGKSSTCLKYLLWRGYGLVPWRVYYDNPPWIQRNRMSAKWAVHEVLPFELCPDLEVVSEDRRLFVDGGWWKIVFFKDCLSPICRCTLCFKGWIWLASACSDFWDMSTLFDICAAAIWSAHRIEDVIPEISPKVIKRCRAGVTQDSFGKYLPTHIPIIFVFPGKTSIPFSSLLSETFLSGWTSWRSSWCFGFGEVGDSGLSAEMLGWCSLRFAKSKWENMGRYEKLPFKQHVVKG